VYINKISIIIRPPDASSTVNKDGSRTSVRIFLIWASVGGGEESEEN